MITTGSKEAVILYYVVQSNTSLHIRVYLNYRRIEEVEILLIIETTDHCTSFCTIREQITILLNRLRRTYTANANSKIYL